MYDWVIWVLIAFAFAALLLGIVCLIYAFFIIHKNFRYKMEKEYTDKVETFINHVLKGYEEETYD